jgi:hypothetical protein
VENSIYDSQATREFVGINLSRHKSAKKGTQLYSLFGLANLVMAQKRLMDFVMQGYWCALGAQTGIWSAPP